MQFSPTALKPLSTIQLTAEEQKMIDWMRRASWEPLPGGREPAQLKTKVPEFFGGVRLYKLFAGGPPSGAGSMGALEVFLKKLQYQGIIGKQTDPVTVQGNARFLTLTLPELDHLGVGQEDDEEYD